MRKFVSSYIFCGGIVVESDAEASDIADSILHGGRGCSSRWGSHVVVVELNTPLVCLQCYGSIYNTDALGQPEFIIGPEDDKETPKEKTYNMNCDFSMK
eukprot:10299438-Ditylum_brightwellii.AAC.1